jgi:DTW domain-containing protein YfiP
MTPTRPTCPRCRLPQATCVCALVAPVRNGIEVLVLQHPLEAREAKGSARLLALSLARCRVEVGEVFEPGLLDDWLHAGGQRSALLYPDAPEGVAARHETSPTQLVVLDATWRKSLRMLKTNAMLEALPRVSLAPEASSAYGPLRKARRAGQLSTLEAACLALGALEGEAARYAPLMHAFERFVAASLARAAEGVWPPA